MIRALRSRGCFAVACNVQQGSITAAILLLDEDATTGPRWLEDIDTGDRHWVNIPAIATPAYQVRLPITSEP